MYERQVIDYFEKEELSKLESRKLLSICDDIYKREGIQYPDFKEIFKGKPNLKEKYEIYGDLYNMHVIYVTTNYDDHLDEEALKRKPKRGTEPSDEEPTGKPENNLEQGRVIYQKKDLLISNLANGTVIHLHGSIKDRSSMVITLVDYMNHYYETSFKVVSFLQELFNKYTVLFVGYGLEEYEILEFMINKIPRTEKNISHFILYPFFKSQKKIVKFQKKYFLSMGIELIPYYIDKFGHSSLVYLMREWSRQIAPISKPQAFLDKIRIIDEVL